MTKATTTKSGGRILFRAATVEIDEAEAIFFEIGEDVAADEKAGDDKEHVNADEAAADGG